MQSIRSRPLPLVVMGAWAHPFPNMQAGPPPPTLPTSHTPHLVSLMSLPESKRTSGGVASHIPILYPTDTMNEELEPSRPSPSNNNNHHNNRHHLSLEPYASPRHASPQVSSTVDDPVKAKQPRKRNKPSLSCETCTVKKSMYLNRKEEKPMLLRGLSVPNSRSGLFFSLKYFLQSINGPIHCLEISYSSPCRSCILDSTNTRILR